MPLPLTVSCFSKIQIGFTFLVPAHLDSPRKRAIKRVCVCVYLVTYSPNSNKCSHFNNNLFMIFSQYIHMHNATES